MQNVPVSTAELAVRLRRLREAMTLHDPDWQMLLLEDKINLYYFTGTMQQGLFVVTPDRATYFIRQSFACALHESTLPDIRQFSHLSEVAASFSHVPPTIYVAANSLTVGRLQRMQKFFPAMHILSADPVLASLRAVKSEYELDCMRRSGVVHQHVLENLVPTMIGAGISEAKLCCEISSALIERGGGGISRFQNPMGEEVLGICSFGENSLHRNALDSPSGTVGTCFAMKSIGSCSRRLHTGDLILIDIPNSFLGYHTDKSICYFCGDLTRHRRGDLIHAAREQCIALEKQAASLLRPGAVPSEIYQKILDEVDPAFRGGFMNGCKFIGHSVGLTMDETPVLAAGFGQPLQAGMTIAVEPKIAIEGIGLVGTENTYEVVSEGSAVSLTGNCDTNFFFEQA